MFENMPEEKLKKTVVGLVVAGTILVVLLLCVILYQFISMGIKGGTIKDLKRQIAEYRATVQDLEDQEAVYQTDKKKEELARQWGYVYPDDKGIEDLI